MKFKHREPVRIVKGFHKGTKAVVIGSRYFWPIRDYLVVFNWKNKITGETWNTNVWISEKHLVSLSTKKEGNVIIANFTNKTKVN